MVYRKELLQITMNTNYSSDKKSDYGKSQGEMHESDFRKDVIVSMQRYAKHCFRIVAET